MNDLASINALTERPPPVFWWSMWGLGAAYAIVLSVIDVTQTSAVTPIGRDFSNLWVAGKLTSAGRTSEIYNMDAFQAAIQSLLGTPAKQNFSYPPHDLFLAVPIATMPYFVALVVWTVAGAIFFAWAARPYIPFHPALALLTPAALINVWAGHYGLFLGGLWLLFFHHLGTSRAGWVAALLTIKPHMGVVIAFAAVRYNRTVIVGLLGTTCLVAASLLLFGRQPWIDYLTVTTRDQAAILMAQGKALYFSMMPTTFVSYGRGNVAAFLQVGSAVAALALIARLKTPDPFAYATATFLLLPYAFNYDMTVVSLGFAILLWDRWAALGWPARLLAGAAFLSPELTFKLQWAVPLILLAGLWMQVQLIREGPESISSPTQAG